MNGEVWVTVAEAPNYDVSCMGRIRSWIDNKGRRRTEPLIIKPTINDGYRVVCLYEGGSRSTRKVSVLVALAFIGPKQPGMQVCHNDGVRTNDRKENLRYDTHMGNQLDKIKHGTTSVGERNGRAKINEDGVRAVRRFLDDGWEQFFISKLFGISEAGVRAIKTGKIWKHVDMGIGGAT